MNILLMQNAARAAWETARTICACPDWDTLDAASRADWYARFEKQLNAGAIAAQDAAPGPRFVVVGREASAPAHPLRDIGQLAGFYIVDTLKLTPIPGEYYEREGAQVIANELNATPKAPAVSRDVLALDNESLGYFAQKIVEGQDIGEAWEDATDALPMPPAIAALARAARNPARAPMLESASLLDVIGAILADGWDGPTLGHVHTSTLYMIQRGGHWTDEQATEQAFRVARELKEIAQAIEAAH